MRSAARSRRPEPTRRARPEQAQKLTERLVALQGLVDKQDKDGVDALTQLTIQLKAAVLFVVYAFVPSPLLVWATQAITRGNFRTDTLGEAEGLDRTEYGEVGFDFSTATESVTTVPAEPRAASVPRGIRTVRGATLGGRSEGTDDGLDRTGERGSDPIGPWVGERL